jgi:uncharacterized protein YndB with AHSA1/START domain
MADSQEPIVVVQELAAPLSTVWEAITDPERMRAWYFDTIADFRAELGFEARFNVNCEGTDFEHIWLVQEVVPGQRLVYGWRYEGLVGDASVQWELAETPTGTQLTFTQRVHDSFPDNPLFTREAGIAGWDYFVRQTLKAYVEEGRRTNA